MSITLSQVVWKFRRMESSLSARKSQQSPKAIKADLIFITLIYFIKGKK
jgi:hypothetical protein